jgi:hypothetical protein
VSRTLAYPENEYSRDQERMEAELGERKVAGLTSREFKDVKLRWNTGLEEEQVMDRISEELGFDQEALGARLENDALVNYSEGAVQYSSPDGDLSLLSEVLEASTEEDVYAESFVEGLSDMYGWLEK